MCHQAVEKIESGLSGLGKDKGARGESLQLKYNFAPNYDVENKEPGCLGRYRDSASKHRY